MRVSSLKSHKLSSCSVGVRERKLKTEEIVEKKELRIHCNKSKFRLLYLEAASVDMEIIS